MKKKVSLGLLSIVLSAVLTFAVYLGLEKKSDTNTIREAQALTTNWDQVNSDGFGVDHQGQQVYLHPAGDYLFVTSRVTTDPAQASLWKYRFVAGTDEWTNVTSTGCGNSNNQYFSSITEFNGDIVVVSQNSVNGQMVYKIDPTQTSCDVTDLITNATTGISVDISRVGDLFVFNNNLYAIGDMSADQGVRVMRWDLGTIWTGVITGGINDPDENFASACAATSQAVYCAVREQSTAVNRLYRSMSNDLSTWAQIGADNFGNSNVFLFMSLESLGTNVYIGSYNVVDGTQIWQYGESSAALTEISNAAIKVPENVVAQSFGEMNGYLYAGVSATNGGKIYRYAGTGTAWTEASAAGFGTVSENYYITSLANYKFNLYAGVPKKDDSPDPTRVYRFRDSTNPAFSNLSPINGATGVAKNTNLTFTVTDDETGNDTTSLTAVMTGSSSGAHTYVTSSSLVTLNSTNARQYNFSLNPNNDFTPGETVQVNLSLKDRFVSPNTGSASFSFKIAEGDVTAPQVSVNPGSGLYTVSVTISISTNEPLSVIYVTTDGTTPTTSSSVYTGPITITKDTVLKVLAVDPSGNPSDVITLNYQIRKYGPPFIVAGAGFGGNPHVKVYQVKPNGVEIKSSFFAFDGKIRCGVRVTTGDVDKDGQDEIIVGSGEGCNPHVRVFEKDGTLKPIDFRPFHPNSKTGVDVAAGDVDGDGKDEIIMSQFKNGDPWVKICRYNGERTIMGEWIAYEPGHDFGATVAAGDLDYDGIAEVITGAGKPGDPHVRVFEPNGDYRGDILAYPMYGHPETRRGIDVGAGDIDGDGKVEIATSVLGQIQSYTKVYRWNAYRNIVMEIKPYAPKWVGTNVTLGDLDGDGKAELLTGPGVTGGPHIRAFEMNKQPLSHLDFFPFLKNFRGGTDIAIGYDP